MRSELRDLADSHPGEHPRVTFGLSGARKGRSLKVKRIQARKPVLRDSSLGHLAGICTIQVTDGSLRYDGICEVSDGIVGLHFNTAVHLRAELSKRSSLPRAVCVCPGAEPFPPQSEIQAEVVRTVEVLAQRGIDAWLATRGYIRPFALASLTACREHIKLTVGLTTIDRRLQRTLEPLAASPRLRLRQIARLRDLGMTVQVALEPLVPGMTDTRANLVALLETLAGIGVRQITAGYLFLRPVQWDRIRRIWEPTGLAEYLLPAFEHGPVLAGRATLPARFLPKSQRQRGYAALMALAAEFGITVRLSRAANPDFQPPDKQPSPGPSLPLFAAHR